LQYRLLTIMRDVVGSASANGAAMVANSATSNSSIGLAIFSTCGEYRERHWWFSNVVIAHRGQSGESHQRDTSAAPIHCHFFCQLVVANYAVLQAALM